MTVRRVFDFLLFLFFFFVVAVVTVVVVVVVVVAVVVSVSVIAEKAPGDAMSTKDGSDACDNLLFALSTACGAYYCRYRLVKILLVIRLLSLSFFDWLPHTINSSSNSKYLAVCSIRCLYASVVASLIVYDKRKPQQSLY